MSNPFEFNRGDNQKFDAKQAMDDTAHLGGQIWHDMKAESPKIVDYVTKTPVVADTAGALCSLAIVLAPEAPPAAIALGTLGVTMFGAKAVYDLAEPAIKKAGESFLKFPTLGQ